MQSLVVLIDGSENDAASLRAAASMAAAVGGKLTVAHTKAADVLPIGTLEIAVVVDTSDYAKESLKRARAAFAEVCGQLPDCRLQEFDAVAADAIHVLSPYHDLIVLERVSEAKGPDVVAFVTALWGTHGAVLVCPPSGAPSAVRHVAVAWNGSMQAGRALRAALPYLRKAAKVTVLQRSGTADDAELKRYLAAHAIPSVAGKSYGQGGLSARGWGRALLAETKVIGADLLVMGAYGSSMGTLLGFGRTTEKIVTSAPLPVLLSA